MTKQVDCSAEACGFSVRTNDEEELVEVVQRHADRQHGLELDDGDVRGMMQDA